MSDQPNKMTRSDGIECRECGCRWMPVVYTRQQNDKIMRRRECSFCGKRHTTYEKVVGSK